MAKKLKEVLGSLRFWMTIVGAVIYYLGSVGIIPIALADTIIGFLGVGVIVRTADKIGS